MTKGKFVFLGTGGSLGIPMVGCNCSVCCSDHPFNKRLRSSAVIYYSGQTFLIDSGPDLRYQALTSHLKQLDGVLFTHAHYDHTAGLDDLRPLLFKKEKPLPVLMSSVTFHDLKTRFHYFFEASPPKIDVHLLHKERGNCFFLQLPLSYFTYEQAAMLVNGFRMGDLAYVSDIKNYPETIYQDLKGLRTLIVSALRNAYSPLHFTVEEAVAFAKRCGAETTYLTHISHELEHFQTEASLPSNIHMAYDKMEIYFNI